MNESNKVDSEIWALRERLARLSAAVVLCQLKSRSRYGPARNPDKHLRLGRRPLRRDHDH